MLVIPAIDIINKQPVRLYQGDYGQKEVVGESILELARQFEKEGAKYLHLVDLDGAKEGSLINQEVIVEVAKTVSIPVEIGGGIRSMEAISYYLDHGLDCVILGTSALEDKSLLKEAIMKYPDKIAVGMDCKDGFVYGRGWLQASKVQYLEFAKELENIGVKTLIVTDISKDGTLSGPNVEMYKTLLKEVNMNIIASGGIKDIEDIKALSMLDVHGAITGKALYHNTLSLKEAIKVAGKITIKKSTPFP